MAKHRRDEPPRTRVTRNSYRRGRCHLAPTTRYSGSTGCVELESAALDCAQESWRHRSLAASQQPARQGSASRQTAVGQDRGLGIAC
eukprot:9497437-Karenia_brevis.AAC.1